MNIVAGILSRSNRSMIAVSHDPGHAWKTNARSFSEGRSRVATPPTFTAHSCGVFPPQRFIRETLTDSRSTCKAVGAVSREPSQQESVYEMPTGRSTFRALTETLFLGVGSCAPSTGSVPPALATNNAELKSSKPTGAQRRPEKMMRPKHRSFRSRCGNPTGALWGEANGQ